LNKPELGIESKNINPSAGKVVEI